MDLLEQAFRSLVSQLRPEANLISQQKQKVNEIFQLLQKYSKYSIARTEIVGSVAKKVVLKTHIDYDCVIFVNDIDEKDRSTVLEEFKAIIVRYTNLRSVDVSMSSRILQFTYKGVEIDLAVAVNHAANIPDNEQPHEIQRVYDLNKIRDSGGSKSKLILDLSPGFSKSAVDFAKKQSPFAHDIALLAKHWNKSINLAEIMRSQLRSVDASIRSKDSYVSGRSSIMELFAFHAASIEEQYCQGKPGAHLLYRRAFVRFLKIVRNIHVIGLKLTSSKMKKGITSPYLIDPADPYHNYLEVISPDILNIFSRCAKKSIERMKNAFHSSFTNINDIFVEQIHI